MLFKIEKVVLFILIIMFVFVSMSVLSDKIEKPNTVNAIKQSSSRLKSVKNKLNANNRLLKKINIQNEKIIDKLKSLETNNPDKENKTFSKQKNNKTITPQKKSEIINPQYQQFKQEQTEQLKELKNKFNELKNKNLEQLN
jgi:cell division protein FtsL